MIRSLWLAIIRPLLLLIGGVELLEWLAPVLPAWLQVIAERSRTLFNLGLAWILTSAVLRWLFSA